MFWRRKTTSLEDNRNTCETRIPLGDIRIRSTSEKISIYQWCLMLIFIRTYWMQSIQYLCSTDVHSSVRRICALSHTCLYWSCRPGHYRTRSSEAISHKCCTASAQVSLDPCQHLWQHLYFTKVTCRWANSYVQEKCSALRCLMNRLVHMCHLSYISTTYSFCTFPHLYPSIHQKKRGTTCFCTKSWYKSSRERLLNWES